MRRQTIQLFPSYLLILLLFSSPVLAQQEDIKGVMKKFLDHVSDVYLPNIEAHMTDEEMSVVNKKMTLKARVFGYALGQQLKYIKKNTPNHRLWLDIERELLNVFNTEVEALGAARAMYPRELEQLKKTARTQFTASLQGWFDDQLVAITGVLPGEAPNFFAILGQETEGKVSLVGIWRDRTGSTLRITGSGSTFYAHFQGLSRGARENGYSKGQLYITFTRVEGNRFRAKQKVGPMDLDWGQKSFQQFIVILKENAVEFEPGGYWYLTKIR